MNHHQYKHGYPSKYVPGVEFLSYVIVGYYPEGNQDPTSPLVFLYCKEHDHIIRWPKRNINQIVRLGKCNCFGPYKKFRKDCCNER